MSSDKSLCKSGTGDIIFQRSDSLYKYYKNLDKYKVNDGQIQSHAHRSIEFKNGKFYSLSKMAYEKSKNIR